MDLILIYVFIIVVYSVLCCSSDNAPESGLFSRQQRVALPWRVSVNSPTQAPSQDARGIVTVATELSVWGGARPSVCSFEGCSLQPQCCVTAGGLARLFATTSCYSWWRHDASMEGPVSCNLYQYELGRHDQHLR